MCFGGGGGQPAQPMTTPDYAPKDAWTAVDKKVTDDNTEPAVADPTTSAAATPRTQGDTGANFNQM